MLYLVISFAKKDLFIDKKKQWKMSQNSEQLARCAGKCDFCDSDKVFTPACAALSRATGLVMRCANVALIRRLRRDQGSARVEPLPPEVLILFGPQMQKSLLIEQAFRIWSVIEDSNLRPLRPERSALPGCANHRMRGASYCWDAYPSMPYFQKIAQPARNSAARAANRRLVIVFSGKSPQTLCDTRIPYRSPAHRDRSSPPG